MTTFNLCICQDKIYLKKPLREALAPDQKEVRAVANSKSMLIFSADVSYEDVLRSLDVIRAEIELKRCHSEGFIEEAIAVEAGSE